MRNLLRIALSIGLSLAILGLLLRLVTVGIDDYNRPQLMAVLWATAIWVIPVFLAIHLVTVVLRAWRYRILIESAGERAPGFFHLLLVTAARNMLVDMLPARVGELGYIAMLNRGYNVKGEVCVSSLGLAFVFDLVAMFFIAVLLALWQTLTGQLQGWVLTMAVAVFIISAVAIAGALWFFPVIADRVLPAWEARGGILGRVTAFIHRVAEAVETTRRAGVLLKVTSISFFVRLGKYLAMFLLFLAVATPSFPDIASTASFFDVFAALVASEGAASLPVPTFMSFGTYEAGGTAVLTMLGFDSTGSFIALFGMHIWSQVVDYTLGTMAIILFLFLTRRVVAESSGFSTRKLAGLAAAGVVMMVGAGFAAWEYRATKKLGSTRPPDSGAPALQSDAERAALDQLASKLDGFVVWSSNRHGNHDILLRDLKSGSVRSLTTNPYTEFYPRVSPDGRYVAFARSQQPWISQRNEVAWNLHLLDLESGAERLLVNNANHATWSGQRTLTFLRGGVQVVEIDINSGDEEVVYKTGREAMPEGAMISYPMVSAERGVVFTGQQMKIGGKFNRLDAWGTAYFDREKGLKPVSQGCQVKWSPDASFLYQVDNGTESGANRFVKIDAESNESVSLLDMDGEFNHEVFPQLSRNQQWLVFGASRSKKENEADTADFEIFLWEVGTSAGDAVRLTFHTGNDNWPDVYLR